jgi:transposase-like protein
MNLNGFTKQGKQRYRCAVCGRSSIGDKAPAKSQADYDSKYYESLDAAKRAERRRKNTEYQRRRRALKKVEK